VRIAVEVGKAFREIGSDVLASWLDLRGGDVLDKFVTDVCEWEVEAGLVKVPMNKDNEARGEIKGEKVGVEMFGRVIKRGFEQAA
jgi:translation initiation factor 3 subunit K